MTPETSGGLLAAADPADCEDLAEPCRRESPLWTIGAEIIVSERGGRIFGPFWGGSGESLFWVNPVFLEPRAFGAFLEAGEWNLGGERLWIAPETQFHVADRRNFWGTYRLPRAIDPGEYRLERAQPDSLRLAQSIVLAA